MTDNRLGKLWVLKALPFACAVAAIGCDSSHSGLRSTRDAAAAASGGDGGGRVTSAAGGTQGVGGKSGAGGANGGATGINTMPANTGGSSMVGIPGLDAGSATADDSGTGGSTMAAPPVVSDSGYVTVSSGTVVMAGFISSATAGSGSSIVLTYGAQDFCASGTVAANNTYKSWANAGFSVNQDQSGASGSSSALVLTGSTLSIGYVNRGGSELEFQLFDGSNYWCYILPPSSTPTTTTIPLSSLNTQCWDGQGSAFTSGTAIRSVSLVVPGSNVSATPFDFCFLGLTVG
jgi:hypothetical protein